MDEFLITLQASSEVTLPVFLLVFLGWGLKRWQWIDDNFINIGSRLVFTLALPMLILIKILEVDLGRLFNIEQVIYGLVATLIGFTAVWFLSRTLKHKPEQRGVFVQGSFRGNLGIIGLALCQNMYGADGLAMGSILMAFLTLSYNILSVFALSAPFRGTEPVNYHQLFINMAKNPLILAVIIGFTMRGLGWHLPPIIFKSGEYFSSMTLPLALLCVGGSINFAALKSSSLVALMACINKLIILPVIFTFGAWLLGLQQMYLGTLFLMFGSPAATVGFIMAKAMKGDAVMAANIIALSTLLSIFTLSLGIFVLHYFQLA